MLYDGWRERSLVAGEVMGEVMCEVMSAVRMKKRGVWNFLG